MKICSWQRWNENPGLLSLSTCEGPTSVLWKTLSHPNLRAAQYPFAMWHHPEPIMQKAIRRWRECWVLKRRVKRIFPRDTASWNKGYTYSPHNLPVCHSTHTVSPRFHCHHCRNSLSPLCLMVFLMHLPPRQDTFFFLALSSLTLKVHTLII